MFPLIIPPLSVISYSVSHSTVEFHLLLKDLFGCVHFLWVLRCQAERVQGDGEEVGMSVS